MASLYFSSWTKNNSKSTTGWITFQSWLGQMYKHTNDKRVLNYSELDPLTHMHLSFHSKLAHKKELTRDPKWGTQA